MADANVRYKVSQVGAEKVASSFTKIGKSILASFGGIIALHGVIRLTKHLKDAARDGEETRNKFDVIFSGIVEGANRMADAFSEKFKLAGVTTRQLLGNTGDLLVGFGFAEQAALDMALRVAELSQDLVSLTNFTGGTTRAADALTKALLGERESVKTLGISILEEDVKLKILELSMQGVTFETERQAKAFATLEIAFDQTQKAAGDAINTMGQLAGQERILDERVKDLSESVGQDLTEGFNDATGAAITAVDAFSDFNEMIKKLTGSLGKAVGVLGLLIKTSFLPLDIVLSVTSGDAFTKKFWESLLGLDDGGKGFKFNFDENVFVGGGLAGVVVLGEVEKIKQEIILTKGKLDLWTGSVEGYKELLKELVALQNQLKIDTIATGVALDAISKQSMAASFRGGGARPARGLSFMRSVFQPDKPELLKDAAEIGDTIFDGWASVLTSNMNTAWAEIFGEANSLFEQLINSMADLLIKDIFTSLLSFIPGGGVLSGVIDLFSGAPGKGGGGQTNITIEMGGMPLGQIVLEGNRQIQQRRLV